MSLQHQKVQTLATGFLSTQRLLSSVMKPHYKKVEISWGPLGFAGFVIVLFVSQLVMDSVVPIATSASGVHALCAHHCRCYANPLCLPVTRFEFTTDLHGVELRTGETTMASRMNCAADRVEGRPLLWRTLAKSGWALGGGEPKVGIPSSALFHALFNLSTTRNQLPRKVEILTSVFVVTCK